MNTAFSQTRFVPGLMALVAAAGLANRAHAVAIPVAAGWTGGVFDTGGLLNPAANGGFTLGGLEVDPAGGRVYVVGANVGVGLTSSSLRMLSSTGLGTAVLDASGVAPLSYATRGTDLTYNAGSYYVAASRVGGAPGIYGFTPGGGQPVYAAGGGIPSWATSGLTFNAAGTMARVTSDLGTGHHSVLAGAVASTLLVGQGAVPGGYGAGADDHAVTPGGRVLVAEDIGRGIYDITGGPGAVALFANPNILGGPGFAGPGVGSRITVHPVSGDLFLAWGDSGDRIIRVAADGLSVETIATGFSRGVRDIDWGLDGTGTLCLFATEVSTTGIGTIYSFKIPAPGTGTLLALGGFCMARRRRR